MQLGQYLSTGLATEQEVYSTQRKLEYQDGKLQKDPMDIEHLGWVGKVLN